VLSKASFHVAVAITLLLATSESHGGASVGAAQQVSVQPRAEATLDELKKLYRRPVTLNFPADNPYTPEKAALGKNLFFDSRLSAANLLSCSSCHNPAFSWSDGQPKGIGHGMNVLGRRSPSILDAGFGAIFMWDGRAGSLEEQALGPIQASVEMNLPLEVLLSRLKESPEYPALFDKAFPGEGIKPETIGKAIATYERLVVSSPAPFDSWINGDEWAIPESAKRGFVLFNGKGRCSECHSEWRFTDDSFHDIGLPDGDIGRGKFLPDVVKAQHAFKTPGLRDIARRGAYMHDGSMRTLRAVVDHYNDGGVDRPSRADAVLPLRLSGQEKDELVAFMETLSGSNNPTVIPQLPR
jgi:cytochrome c peroxidase